MTQEESPKTIIEFKSDPGFFDMEASGEKPFTVRRWDFADERFRKLYEWSYLKKTPIAIKITNTKDRRWITRELRGVEYLHRCPHWMIIYLGALVENSDTDPAAPKMEL